MIYIKILLLLVALISPQSNLDRDVKYTYAKKSPKQINRQPAEDVTHLRVNNLLTKEALETASDVATQLLKICAPPRCKVVGLGSSPALLIAYLQATDPASAISLPISDFRHSPRQAKKGFNINNAEDTALDNKTKNSLFDYFENFLVPQLGSDTEQVILVDFTNTGRSLFAAQSYLELFIHERTRQSLDITSVAMLEPSKKKKVQRVGKKYFNISDTHFMELDRDRQFFINMIMSRYDHYSEYGSYRITPKLHREKVIQDADLNAGLPIKNTSLKRKLFVNKVADFVYENKSNACRASLQ